MADAVMAGERSGHTLGPTALTHEVWLRLSKSRNASGLDRAQFAGLAAQAMRRILTEHARRNAALKRGGDQHRTSLEGRSAEAEPQDFALDMEQAMNALEEVDPESVRVVELRFYAGLSNEEAAAALGKSPRTVKRRWRFARAWLQQTMWASEEARS